MKIKTLKKFLMVLFSLTFLILPYHLAYGETYRLEIVDQAYDVKYEFDGDVIAMNIDQETDSLLIATENVNDSLFQIKFPNDLIRAENNEFAVLVNGFEVDYYGMETTDGYLTFFVPAFTEEIEIIGTYVVPEFPLGAMLVLGSVVGIFVIFQRSKNFFIK